MEDEIKYLRNDVTITSGGAVTGLDLTPVGRRMP
jgi:hypothetical protein